MNPPSPEFLASKKRWHVGIPRFATIDTVMMATPGMPIRTSAHTIKFFEALKLSNLPPNKMMAIFRSTIENLSSQRPLRIDWRLLAILLRKEIQTSYISDMNPLVWTPIAVHFPNDTRSDAKNNGWTKPRKNG